MTENNEKKPLPIVKDNLLMCSEDACPLFEEDMGPGWARFCTISPRAELVVIGDTVCLPGIKLEHEELMLWQEQAARKNAEYDFILNLVENPPEPTEALKKAFINAKEKF